MMNACPANETEVERRKRCQSAEEAAEKAVKKTFAILGVDIESPREVSEFQQSLRFSDKLRRTADKGIFAFIITVSGLMGTALWLGLKLRINGE